MSSLSYRRARLHDLAHSPVGLWQFDGDLTDDSGNGYDLTVDSGTERYTAARGVRFVMCDGATYLTGSGSHSALQITGALTVEAIVIVAGDEHATNPMMITLGNDGELASDNTLYNFRWMAARNFEFTAERGSGVNLSSANVDGWAAPGVHHMAFSRASDGATCSVYIDGVFIGSDAMGNSPPPTSGTSAALWVGGNQGINLPWTGGIASLKIIASELTAAQVLAEARRTVL